MADPVHGSAPDISGKNTYMPQAMLNGLYQLLTHIGALHSARTLQLALDQPNLEKLAGNTFLEELERQIELLAGIIADSPPVCLYYPMPIITGQGKLPTPTLSIRELIGVDVFIKYTNAPIEILAIEIRQLIPQGVELQLITSRGQQIWPGKHTLDGISDHIKCRFFKQNGAFFSQRVIIEILSKLNEHSVDILKTENLYLFNERAGFLMN
jgi:isocitrate dehydrogenase